MTEKIRGNWNSREVTVGGRRLDPGPGQKVRSHSPDGFNWGYGGSGPAQLALSLLLHYGATNEQAASLYQYFKSDVIARLPQADFEIGSDIVTEWLRARLPGSVAKQDDIWRLYEDCRRRGEPMNYD